MKTGWKILSALLCSLLNAPDPVQAVCRELIDIKNSDCYMETEEASAVFAIAIFG